MLPSLANEPDRRAGDSRFRWDSALSPRLGPVRASSTPPPTPRRRAPEGAGEWDDAREARARAGHGGQNGTPERGARPALGQSAGDSADDTTERDERTAGSDPTRTAPGDRSVPEPDLPGDDSTGAVPPDPTSDDGPPVYDLSYRDAFWPVRDYEDRCDRLALRALLPRTGGSILDVGAGFGRLADEYAAFRRVTLLDASTVLLDAARERYGADERFAIVEGEAAHLPFPDESFDAAVSVRVLVNVHDPLPVFREVHRVLRPGGSFVFEFANRAHVLAAARYLLGRQSWSPSGLDAHEYRPAHFAHHPTRIKRQLRVAGLEPDSIRTVSLFRAAWLKQHVPAAMLAGVESYLQGPLGPLVPGPSVYIRAIRSDAATIDGAATSRGTRPIEED